MTGSLDVRTGRVRAGAVELAYDRFGDPADPAVVLVMGLNTQRIAWPDEFCRSLAGAGFCVVRFDNRDSGESTHFDELPAPSPIAVALRRRRPAYTLDDMAADTVGLLDALGLDRVHLVGASMGGFIAQLVAIGAPERVASLGLIMTSTGSRAVGRARWTLLTTLLRRRPAADRDAAVAQTMATFRLIGSPGFPYAEDDLRSYAGTAYDRGHDPGGQRRQLAAVLGQRDRTGSLAAIGVPTVVLHGLADPLVNPSGGIAIARAVPGARFVGFSGMGHDLPRGLWPDVLAELVAVARRGSAAGTAQPDELSA